MSPRPNTKLHRATANALPNKPIKRVKETCSLRRAEYKDIVVIGWIDPSRVPLSVIDVDKSIQFFYPPDGNVVIPQRPLTFLHLGLLALGTPFYDCIHPVFMRSMTQAEKMYILHWLFKYGSNHCPPPSFVNEDALDKFVLTATGYKLFNRLLAGFFGASNSAAGILHQEARIGTTIEPIFGVKVPGKPHATNGMHGEMPLGWANVYSINRGDPDDNAVDAFNNLLREKGKKWTSIGSSIFQSIHAIRDSRVDSENYPTYWIYERIGEGAEDMPYMLNGDIRFQAPSPVDHCIPDSTNSSEAFVPGGGEFGGGGASC